MTLLDRFGRRHSYLRISVTDRCNLRCFYCMPHEGMAFQAKEKLLTYEEIVRVARVFTERGVNKIRITGGEPLVRTDLEVLLKGLRQLPGVEMLAMTTNGLRLKGNTRLLKQAGVNILNVSLDTLKQNRFIEISKRDALNSVLLGIDEALDVGFDALKLNVVVMKGVNDDEILDFVAFAKDKPLNVRFIEFMPFKSNQWSQGQIVPWRQIKSEVEEKYSLNPIETEASAVAKEFQISNHMGKISFITSMTESFCSACNRIRLTAEGNIKSCLFHTGEVPLRDDLRNGMTDDELSKKFDEALLLKEEAHAPVDILKQRLEAEEKRPMIAIGG